MKLFSSISWLYIQELPEYDRYAMTCAVTPIRAICLTTSSCGMYDVSECDLPRGGERGTGAGTVSLLTLGREVAPSTECCTYATHCLWLWGVHYVQACVHVKRQ